MNNTLPHQGPPSLRNPLLLVGTGLLLTVGYLIVFILLMATSTGPTPQTQKVLSPTPQTVTLKADQWGIYSDAPDLSCSVTLSDGSAVPLQRATQRTYVKPEQAYYFDVPAERPYQVSCSSSLPAELNVSALDDDYMRALTAFKLLPFSMLTGFVVLVPGVVLLLRGRRRRRAYLRTRMELIAQGGSPTAPGWQAPLGGFAASGQPSAFGAVAPAGTSPLGYGQLASVGPAASAPTFSSLPVQADAEAVGTSPTSGAQAGAYGIAPKQVVYRAVPLQDER
ncbi:hypothetical protein [Actinomyces weissii]|uniref:Uncharacterized protein n=1 Tax=Actinomyces weissii TaxID=675090 RepID=A0A7T7M9D2_9ACTO|nr:hypothetical protein [Actinomyces weissii]QQM67150.1 hypothetical protein JG540_08995 [Actinomyces weissii]